MLPISTSGVNTASLKQLCQSNEFKTECVELAVLSDLAGSNIHEHNAMYNYR